MDDLNISPRASPKPLDYLSRSNPLAGDNERTRLTRETFRESTKNRSTGRRRFLSYSWLSLSTFFNHATCGPIVFIVIRPAAIVHPGKMSFRCWYAPSLRIYVRILASCIHSSFESTEKLLSAKIGDAEGHDVIKHGKRKETGRERRPLTRDEWFDLAK